MLVFTPSEIVDLSKILLALPLHEVQSALAL